MLGTLGDVYANPIMVDALIKGREGTTVPENPPLCYAPALPTTSPPPPLDIPQQMERWEPWVRAYIAIGEMLQGITFQPSTPTSTTFQVSSTSLIAEIERPMDATFQAQIPMVLSWAELRNERATEIMAQIDPQYAFWSSIVYMHPDRTRRTFELVNMVLQFCVYVEMRFKQALACYRPVEHNAQVQPMLTTPGHGSYPMGHATQGYAVATVLESLLSLNPVKHAGVIEQLQRQVARIATNRVVAGLHFPVDSMAGRMLGVALGEYFVGRCTGSQTSKSRTFKVGDINTIPTIDFNPFSNDQSLTSASGRFYSYTQAGPIKQSPLMGHVWTMARDEWTGRFGVPV